MAEIPAAQLAAAARALMLAGRWTQAAVLLAAAAPAGDAERAVLAVADAEVAIDEDFWTGTKRGASAVEQARRAVAGPADVAGRGDPVERFEAEFLALRHDYFAELMGPDGQPRFGPSGRDGRVLDALAAQAGRLREAAPDLRHAAAVTFYAGLIEDNLRGDSAAGQALFTRALAEAEQAGNDFVVSEALRHLGYHAGEAGHTEQARQMWQRATELRQRAGAVPYVLSQQLLLAGLARDTGDLDAARTLAGQVRGWARALGIGLLESGAARIEAACAADPADAPASP
jgi:tetratricopeptide (TPR) repeat protein